MQNDTGDKHDQHHKHQVKHTRLEFIEMLLIWQGSVGNKQIREQFKISRPTALKDIVYYSDTYNKLTRPSKSDYYYPNEDGDSNQSFQPKIIKPNADLYLNWLLHGHSVFNSGVISGAKRNAISAEALPLPSRQVPPLVLRGLIASIQQKQRIEVQYVSLSHANQDGRIFQPHTFVYTGVRWHVRGYCEQSKDYRDLVLSRFRITDDDESTLELLGDATMTIEKDKKWQTIVEPILIPDPRLPPEKIAVLINDYQMVNGQLIIPTRAALVEYLLRNMQVNVKHLDGSPEAQQLILHNRDEMKAWMFHS